MFHFQTYLGKCHQLVFYTNSWGFSWESYFPTARLTLVLSSIPPGIESSQGQKSRLLFQSVKIFQTLRFHFDGKTHTILRWISCGFHGFSLFGNLLFWLEIVEHGWGWEGVSNPFLGNMSSFFLRSFKNLRKATWRFARGKRGKNINYQPYQNDDLLDMLEMSSVQTPYAIALYWSVHRNPDNWVLVIPIKLGGISSKKNRNTANNQGFGQSSDVCVHQHSIFFVIFDRSKQITSALAIPSAPVEKPKNGRLQHICCRSGAKIIPIIPSMSLDDFSRFIMKYENACVGMWTMSMFVFCHVDLQKDDTVCNYIVQTYIYICVLSDYSMYIQYVYITVYILYIFFIIHMVTDTIIEETFSLSSARFLTAAGFSIISWSSHSSNLVGTLGRSQLGHCSCPRICRAQLLNLIGQGFRFKESNVSGWPKGLMFIFLPIRWDQGRADV